ncbi:DsbA family protein [Streptomyces tubbatahanensis]|uniref:DsbA family protein n=1 Tax=Streptomyces tubbatahanensis TaxID=2923272 RepID=A0ABY3XZK8_9ACTN|nr:DsbA family protein [Streptomyces tubbatahanensis]UNS99956.1 DsbA family protein [Streptomyces tubbatahanensis]
MSGRAPHRIALVHDFVCARSYLAFTRLRRAHALHRAEGGTARLVLRPYQIRPDAPAEGEPLFDVHRRERGEAVARAIRADRTLGAADGLDLRFDRAVFTNTRAAHHLTAQAAAQHRAPEMAARLFRAYFTDGLNIADPHVLAGLAAEAGVRPEPDLGGHLTAELARTRHLGSPTGPVLLADGHPVLSEEPTEEELRDCLRSGAPR